MLRKLSFQYLADLKSSFAQRFENYPLAKLRTSLPYFAQRSGNLRIAERLTQKYQKKRNVPSTQKIKETKKPALRKLAVMRQFGS